MECKREFSAVSKSKSKPLFKKESEIQEAVKPGLTKLSQDQEEIAKRQFNQLNDQHRVALTHIQKSGTTREDEMVGRQKVVTGARKVRDCSNSPADKPGSAPAKPKTSTPKTVNKVGHRVITKRKYADKFAQTENPDIELITGEEAPLIYWKELAESRRLALQEALEENQNLHERIDDLEKENGVLEEMVQEAKHLAEIISNISEDENDESGIGGDSEVVEYDQDVSSTY